MEHTAAEANLNARGLILRDASRYTRGIYSGKLIDQIEVSLCAFGLATHITVEGNLDFVRWFQFADLNNIQRVDCSVDMLTQRNNVILIPLATVFFDGPDFYIKDLKGALYLSVVSATARLTIFGESSKLIVKQHGFDFLPTNDRNMVILPFMDLSHRNIIKEYR